jgi:hypothetical protein
MRFRRNDHGITRQIADEALLRAAHAGGGGGGGITQLTGEVLAGPGSGSQRALMGPRPVASQLVYVSAGGGNDTTATGTIALPYATLAAAIASISDASEDKLYSVLVGPGNYDEDLVLKPFVFVDGMNESLNQPQFNSVVLDASFTHADDFGATSGCGIVGPVAITMTATGQIIDAFNVDFGDTVSITGFDAACSCFFSLVAFQADTTISIGLLSTQSNIFYGPTTTFEQGASSGVNWLSLADSIRGALNITGTTQAAVVLAIGSGVSGTLTLDGADVSYSATSPGIPTTLVLTGGAPAPLPLTGSEGVAYVPAVSGNWVGPAPTTVQQALDRIAANTTNAHPIP